MKKTIAIVCFILAAGVMGYWAMDGQHMANQFKTLKVTMVEDDFGDKEEKKEWIEEFHLGLMDGALPASGALAGLGAVLIFLEMRGKT
ncbi:MAG: hypothetical protein KC502_16170 [Myxococcales bacterium]|nr:hypothetical protein [Myxococcales bacterium]